MEFKACLENNMRKMTKSEEAAGRYDKTVLTEGGISSSYSQWSALAKLAIPIGRGRNIIIVKTTDAVWQPSMQS